MADLVFVVRGLAPETWQDIGNAQGCLYMRNHGFMVASSYFLGSSKKLVYTLRRSLYKEERGSVEEIPTNLKSELHDGPSPMKVLFCRFLVPFHSHSLSPFLFSFPPYLFPLLFPLREATDEWLRLFSRIECSQIT